MWIDDQVLRRAADQIAIVAFVPDATCVVLGASNDAERETNAHACAADGVEILRRYGGGGTVVLHDGCVIVSIGCWVRQHFQNKLYFERVNAALVEALARLTPSLAELSQRGLSDLALGVRKVAGTSLFRSRNYLLYQASILVDPKIDLLERYLAHPSREPDYRAGRTHRAFVVGISELVPGVTSAVVAALLRERLHEALIHHLAEELGEVHLDQLESLYARANSRLATTVK